MKEIKKHEYHGYKSQASKWKAQCITIGDYKLYFSYDTLIAFETPNKCYKLDEHWSFTTRQHRYSAGGGWRSQGAVQFVSSKLLNLLVYSVLLNQPFEEAQNNAGIHCERVS